MAVTVVHTTQATGTDAGNGEIGKTQWNEAHQVVGLGTAAEANVTDFATAAQGTKADSALQPADIGVSVQAYDADLTSWAAIAPSAKQDTLVSATNIKTVNGNSLLGSGDLTVGASIPVSDEGTQITAAVTSFNFTGAGVTATASSGAVTVNVAGGGGSSSPIPNLSAWTIGAF